MKSLRDQARLQKEIIEVQELFEREYEKIDEQNYIVLSENTILAKSNLGLYAQRILKVVASLIKEDDQPHKQYRFRTEDFCKVFNLGSHKIHNNIKNGFMELKKSFILPIGNGRVTSWISYGQIYDNDIVVEFDPILLPLYQKALQGQYKLINVTGFAYSYTFRFYELFCLKLGNKTQCEFEIDIQNLKKWLQIEDKYKNYNDLKKRILVPVMEDMNGSVHNENENNYCNLRVSYEEIKNGRKIIALTFKVNKINTDESCIKEINIADEFFDSLNPEAQVAYTHFRDTLKVSKSAIVTCVQKYGQEVFTKIYLGLRHKPNNGIKNMAGYAATCLRQGFYNEEPEEPKRLLEEKERIKKQADEFNKKLQEEAQPTPEEIEQNREAEIRKMQREKLLQDIKRMSDEEQRFLFESIMDFLKSEMPIQYSLLKKFNHQTIYESQVMVNCYLTAFEKMNE